MIEFLFGFAVGGGVVGLFAIIRHYVVRNAELVEQEKDYALLQQHVDKAVDIIDRIINRSGNHEH